MLCLLPATVSAIATTVPAAPDSSSARSPYAAVLNRGIQERNRGAYQSAIRDFETALRLATEARDVKREAEAINKIATCYMLLCDFRQALAFTNTAAQMGETLRDDDIRGAAENTKSAVYGQLGDYELAESAARRSVAYLQTSRNLRRRATAMVNYGDILARSGDTESALTQFRAALALAQKAGSKDTEALAEDLLGEALNMRPDAAGASDHLNKAYALFTGLGDNRSATVVLMNLAAVRAETEHKYADALRILDSIRSSRTLNLIGLRPFWEPKLRGECLEGLHRERAALAQFETAVSLAAEWRRASMPSDASSSETLVLLHEVYADYIELAARIALRDHDTALSRRALSVLMEHRASTLREQMVATLGRGMTLPPVYFDLLSRIQAEEAAVTLGGGKDLAAKRAELRRLQNRLVDVENSVALNGANQVRTNAPKGGQVLAQVQRKLLHQELLLSFFLGKQNSYVWAVTDDKVTVYELPDQSVIAQHAKTFSDAARNGAPAEAGRILSNDLFGKIAPNFAGRPDWLIAADGALLDSVPFSALPEPPSSSMALSATHSLRFTPSEVLLTQHTAPVSNAYFVGVADPIYNLADSRLSVHRSGDATSRPQVGITLARLVASEHEVRLATGGMGFSKVTVLSGASATGAQLRNELAVAPEVLHFAVHIVSPDDPKSATADEAGVALSIGPDGLPELLTKDFVSTLRIPGTLVVLSGCASQRGKTLPSAGLVGLSRAWLLAGASAVLVTAWPTPDDSGNFFAKFYRHLQAVPQNANLGRRAAIALQATQIEMQKSSGYMSEPSFWAAYSLISKE